MSGNRPLSPPTGAHAFFRVCRFFFFLVFFFLFSSTLLCYQDICIARALLLLSSTGSLLFHDSIILLSYHTFSDKLLSLAWGGVGGSERRGNRAGIICPPFCPAATLGVAWRAVPQATNKKKFRRVRLDETPVLVRRRFSVCSAAVTEYYMVLDELCSRLAVSFCAKVFSCFSSSVGLLFTMLLFVVR